MKNIMKLASLVLCVVILASALALCPLAESENRFGRQILSSMPNSSALLAAYDELCDGSKEIDSEIKLSKKITAQSLGTVFAALFSDYPEYFWLTGGYTYTEIGTYVTSVNPEYLFSRSKIAAATAALENMADKMLEGVSGKSDYDTALILHDRLAERVVYKSTDNDQTAYGAIVEGEAVCAGYARAYHYLLLKAGIESWSVQGDSINPATNKKEGHRWNMVKLDGKWYYSDVTWDDQPDTIYHSYFNRTLSYFNNTHFPDEFKEYLPDDNSTELDYFIKNDLVFNSVDTDRLVKLLKKTENTAVIYVDGDMADFLDALGKKMEKIVTSLGAKGGASYTYTSSYLGNELVLSVIIEQKGHTHSLKKIAEISPSCYETGMKEYYKCSCGRLFTDANGKNEITSTESLVLDKIAHTPSDELSFDETAHWKHCAVCNADIDGSTSLHTDENDDLICDVCNAESNTPFVKDEGGSAAKKSLPLPLIGVLCAIVIGFIFKLFKRR